MKMLFDQVRSTIERYHMLQKGDRIAAGISGGADSVCLLRLLCELRKEYSIWIGAVHVHHGIRGADADADARFVEELCRRLGVACAVVYREVPDLAKEWKRSEEETGRMVRYEAFAAYREEWGCKKTAVAHNREDNAETVLWNLCRGSGPAGLAGIRPVAGEIIRPLLFTGRADIEGYLSGLGQDYRTDGTNREDGYTRNRIRHTVLPVIEEQINRQAGIHLAETAERMRVIGDYIAAQAGRELDRLEADAQGGMLWRAADFISCPEALKGEVLLLLMKRLSGHAGDFTARHVRAAGELFGKEVGKEICLPYGTAAVRTYEGVRFFQRGKEPGEAAGRDGSCRPAPIPGVVELAECGWRLSFRLWDCTEGGKRRIEAVSGGEIRFSDGENAKFPESSCTKWFDYDRIYNTVDIRIRRPGDEIVIHPEGGRKKLKDYFIDRKLPKEERDKRWLLAEGSRILWIPGERTGENYRITVRTKRILVVQIEDGGK